MEGTTSRSELHIGEVTVSLDEAEEVLSAIRHGHIDAVVVEGGDGEHVYTFRDPSHPYRVLLETMSEGAALITFEGLICYHNPHLADLLESAGASLSGSMVSELVAPEDLPRLEALLVDAQRQPTRAALTLVGSAGGPRPVLLSLSAASLADIPVFCVIATDLREHNRQQELYRAARLEVEERDRLVSVAAHELRGPLNAITLQAELLPALLQQGGDDGSRVDRIARSIAVHSRHLAELVTALLDVGGVTAGRLRLHVGELDLADVVRAVHGRCEDLITQSGSSIALDLRPARGRWDGIRMVQVVTNLISNAVKYGGGQPIRVAVDCDAERGVARLVVEDHGCGVPVGERERIFRPYERLAGAASVPGLGLGLYITLEIVKAHRGTIRVEDGPDIGARFVVELPLDGEPG